MTLKNVQYFGIDTRNTRVVFLVQSLDHDLRNERNIFFSLRQWRKHDLKHAQPVSPASLRLVETTNHDRALIPEIANQIVGLQDEAPRTLA
jgi:hypothetical protein